MELTDDSSPEPLAQMNADIGKQWQRRLTLVVLVLITVPILYVLSIGPAYRAEMRHGFPEETYQAIYAPILSLSERYDPIHEFIHWYVELWV